MTDQFPRPMTSLTIYLDDGLAQHIDALVALGLYGKDRGEVAIDLIRQGVRSAIRDGIVETVHNIESASNPYPNPYYGDTVSISGVRPGPDGSDPNGTYVVARPTSEIEIPRYALPISLDFCPPEPSVGAVRICTVKGTHHLIRLGYACGVCGYRGDAPETFIGADRH